MSAPRTLRASYAGTVGRFVLDASFEVPLAGVTALFGPSGSGKTVLLRCIAGLTRLGGQLVVGDERWDDAARGLHRPAHERRIGYVFQEPSLFAHLSVRENLLFGYRRAGRADARVRPEEVIALLGVEPLLDRLPLGLSGGERQRVALGRALLVQPEVLLMDEPLSALDRTAKEEILPYLEAVQRSLGIPVLYVTHDIDEVERLADQLVLLQAGRVVASGPIHDVLADPHTALARGPEAAALLETEVSGYDALDVVTTLRSDAGELLVPGQLGPNGTRVRIRIAAQDVSLALERPVGTTILNVLPARIEEIAALEQGRANVLLELCGGSRSARLLARVTQRSVRALRLGVGDPVYAQVKAASIVDARGSLDPMAQSPGGARSQGAQAAPRVE